MAGPRIRVLVVDDSNFVQTVIKAALARHPEVEVVGVARDGVEGLQMISRLRPDVVTLDVEMPRMNGIQVLDRAAGKVPVSFLMVSTLTQAGARITFDALERGAFDYVSKPTKGIAAKTEFRKELYEKIVGAYRAKGRKPIARTSRSSSSAPSLPPSQARGWVVAIGVSCGGPPTLAKMLPAFPSDFPPILVTQHMPPEFTPSFAKHLDAVCAMNVREAADGDVPEPGTVLVAPGHSHLKLVRCGINLSVQLDTGPKVSGHRPSADVMFESAARTCGPRAVGVILTGMGSDGAAGLQFMSRAGSWTIAQDEETCVVYGMPKAAMATGCIDHQVSLDRIPQTIARLMQKGQRVTAKV
ncbi:MAG: chemotaxis response regulator protein-glutamate methylesterase [Phycisphaerae bacterium]|nr:chemotaxis response regulator protein-glutamate methylesterase [Phycisphaerae bacterium]